MAQFQYFELGSFLLSLILIPRLKGSEFIWFVPYLLIVVFIDIVANYLPLMYNGSNQWRFNLYLPVQNFFFSYLFYRNLEKNSYRQLIKYGAILFSIFYFVNVIWVQGLWAFNSNVFLVTAFQLIVYSNLYYLEMIGRPSIESSFKDPVFWISSSCLIFFTSFAVFFAVYSYYTSSHEAFGEHQFLYLFINKYVNTIHYSLLMIALITYTRKIHV